MLFDGVMVDNRRLGERIAAPYEIAVIGSTGGPSGRLANFSADGLMLISAQKWQEKQHYKVTLKPELTRLHLPPNPNPNSLAGCSDIGSLMVEIECLWVEVQGDMSWVGAQFLANSPNQIVLIASWVNGFKLSFS